MAEVRARETFFAATKSGQTRQVVEGEIFDMKDPLVKGREHLFVAVKVASIAASNAAVSRAAEPAVEQATAAPGEKRAVAVPKKRLSAKKR